MFYIELESKNWDLSRLQLSWQKVLTRHKKQFFKAAVPASAFKIALLDCATETIDIVQKKQELLRQELLRGNSQELQTQGFVIKAIKAGNSILRLFIAFLPALMDFEKFYLLWREWQVYYQDSKLELAIAGHQPIAAYWKQRLEQLPDSAKLPEIKLQGVVRFQHYEAKLKANDYRRLKVLSQKQQVSLTTLILVIIQDIIVEEVQSVDFRLNLILGNRLPLYPYLGDKAEYATSVVVLPLILQSETQFVQRVQNLAGLLREDAKHLTMSTLPMLQHTELLDNAWLPIQVECNLQQGLREVLLPSPADIIYYAGSDLRVNYEVSIWEHAGEICYRCSMPNGVAEKFKLHQLLIERMQQLANEETLWQAENIEYVKVKTKNEAKAILDLKALHESVAALLQYEQALKIMQQSLSEKADATLYVKQFKEQRLALEQCAGHLWSKVNQPPYADDLQALFKGHNLIGEMFQRDALKRVEIQIEKQWQHLENLKKIFEQNPPPKLSESPQIKAVQEFKIVSKNPNLSIQEFKAAIKKLQQEVFGGSK